MSRVRQWWFAIVPALLGGVLAVWGVGSAGPWFDELFTMHAVAHGLAAHLIEAPHLPYYAVAWAWSGAGRIDSIEWLRLLSGLAVVAGSVAVAFAGRRMVNERIGFVAATLFVIAPGISRYGQEARGYALAAACGAMATWALVEAADGGRRRWWVAYGVGLGTAVLILPSAWAILPAHLAILLGYPDRRRHLRDGAATLLALTPVLAVDAFFATAFSALHSWLPSPAIAQLPVGIIYAAHSEYTRAFFPAALVLLGLLSATGRRWLIGLCASVAVVWAVSALGASWWTPRSFLPLAAVLCLAAAAGTVRFPWPVVAALLVVLAAMSIPDHLALRQPGARGPEVEQIIDVLDNAGRAGDRLLITPDDPLDGAVAVFLTDDKRFTRTLTPVAGRYWELAREPSCVRFDEWAITGGGPLRLCR